MDRRVIRDIRSVLVGVNSTLLLPERNARLLTVVGAPSFAPFPATSLVQTGKGASVAAPGTVLSFTPGSGVSSTITGWSWSSASATAVLALQLVRAGNTLTVDVGPANVWRNVNMTITGGDIIQIAVTTAGGVGDVADLVIAGNTFFAGPRISLGFGAAAVLDKGVTITAGQLPLILPGPALDTEVYAVADVVNRTVNVIDLFYP